MNKHGNDKKVCGLEYFFNGRKQKIQTFLEGCRSSLPLFLCLFLTNHVFFQKDIFLENGLSEESLTYQKYHSDFRNRRKGKT